MKKTLLFILMTCLLIGAFCQNPHYASKVVTDQIQAISDTVEIDSTTKIHANLFLNGDIADSIAATRGYVDANGGGGTTINGTTDNGLLTYINSSGELQNESVLTFDGSTGTNSRYLTIFGDGNDNNGAFHVDNNSLTFVTLGNVSVDGSSSTGDQVALLANGLASTDRFVVQSKIESGGDSGSVPALQFVSNVVGGGGDLSTRPLFAWYNNATKHAQMDADGTFRTFSGSTEFADGITGDVVIGISSETIANTELRAFSARGSGRVAYIGVYNKSTTITPVVFLERPDGTDQWYFTNNSGNLMSTTSSTSIGTGGAAVGDQSSDIRLKDTLSYNYGLDEILQINPIKFTYKDDVDKEERIGFSAQEVQGIIPEVVYETGEKIEGSQEGETTKLAMRYAEIVPVLVSAIKEQNALIEDLKARIETLENQ